MPDTLLSKLKPYSGNFPRARATYSLWTPPSAALEPPNHAPSFFDPSTVKEQTMIPEVNRSSRFEAIISVISFR